MSNKFMLLAFLGLALSACVSLKDSSPAPTHYRIQALTVSNQQKAIVTDTIMIEKPHIVSALDTRRIALVHSKGRILDYYAGAQWSGRLNKLLEEFIVESLSHHFNVILQSDYGINQLADYKVTTRLIDYQAEYVGSPQTTMPEVKLTLIATLIRIQDKSVVKQLRITDTQRVKHNNMGSITNALEKLLHDAFTKINRSFSQAILESKIAGHEIR